MGAAAARSALASAGRAANEAVSFVVFLLLDALEVLLCVVYKVADYVVEGAWRPCYCSSRSASSPASAATGKIVVSERGGSKVVSMLSATRLHLEDISDTLYTRPSVLACAAASSASASSSQRRAAPGVTVHSAIVQMLRGKVGGGVGDGKHRPYPSPRWSDCHCANCNPADTDRLFVHVEAPPQASTEEDVLFIHGFISSSGFWTETVLPHVSPAARSRRRLFAVDLLGFGRSPKPADSLYTLREHVEMIERSVIERHGVQSFHIVAHSLGSILALALAVRHPAAVRSLTLVAPPYFPVPRGEVGTRYVLRTVAPRRVWPPIAFGASVACWYEHLSRTVSIVLCKHHRLWELAFRVFTLYRVRTYLMDGFFCHTHIASWHTLHNIICGSAGKIDRCLEVVRDQLTCDVTVYHGSDDELLPVQCSYAVKSKIPRAQVKVIDGKDHVTIVVGRQKDLARELEEIWDRKR
ncbi:probable lysophospholipase BODYGUARD 3 [Miscanthus floridulus]|uniref:probable lysophospholipase BODYGUARD 3 n=1 Tax=Miscanthus floridulus TaxID=154761 RepID=UPI00345B1168